VVARICELSRVCARPESSSICHWLVDSDFRIGSIRRWIVDSILVRLVIGLTCIGTRSDLAAFHILVLHKGSFGTEASTLTCQDMKCGKILTHLATLNELSN
jgi:hypothetical protein